ncbi:MAG: tRNA pseudouridine(55) synthase TruB [Granulosicoccaceae bacterium]
MARNKRGRLLHGLLLLDKPTGISSNKALQQAKRLFDARKAGHTGSLDPLATGMLPICFGEATKLSRYLLNADKTYLAQIKLGEITDSADSDGELIASHPVPVDLDLQKVDQFCQQFAGAQMQVPPMVSAIKIDGKRLYKLAREGITVERPPRAVVIHNITTKHYADSVITVSVSCSKGTYIRSLATDIGEVIGCGGHIQFLRRCHVSPFDHQPMVSLEQIEQHEAPDELLLSLDAGIMHLPQAVVLNPDLASFGQGRQVPANFDSDDIQALDDSSESADVRPIRVYSEDSRLLGLAKVAEDGLIAPLKVIQWD